MKKLLLAVGFAAANLGVCAQTGGAIAKAATTGQITIGVRDSSGALSYSLGDGKYAGYHHEICLKIVTDIERITGRKVEIKYVPVTSQNRIALVQNGTVDLECGSTTNNAARQKDVAFVLTTYVEEVRMAVKAGSGITSIAQLGGKTVATTAGTTSVQLLRKHERANEVSFTELFGKDHAESFLLLESGRADAFVMDSQILAGNIATARNPADYRIVGEVLGVEPIAIMLRKDDVALKRVADSTVRSMIRSGELAKEYDRWFVQPIPPKNTRVGLPPTGATLAAWASPNDRPAEDYAKK